jgi:hypothetical protein
MRTDVIYGFLSIIVLSGVGYGVQPKPVYEEGFDSRPEIQKNGVSVMGGEIRPGVYHNGFYSASDDEYILLRPQGGQAGLDPRHGSIDFWFMLTDEKSARNPSGTLLDCRIGTSNSNRLIIALDPRNDKKFTNAVLYFKVFSDEIFKCPPVTVTSDVKIEPKTWHHVAVTWDNFQPGKKGDLREYFDGFERFRAVNAKFNLRAFDQETISIGRPLEGRETTRSAMAFDQLRFWKVPIIPGPMIADKMIQLRGLANCPPTPWKGNKIGISDDVPPPWTDVQGDENNLTCWGRTYRYSNMDILPTTITTGGKSILSRPITMTIKADNEYAKLAEAKKDILEKKPGSITVHSTAGGKSVRVDCTTKMEFDGMMKIDLELKPVGRSVELNEFVIDIPIKKENGSLLNAVIPTGAKYWFLYLYWTKTFSGAVPAKGLDLEFYPFVWIGDDTCGLYWFSESDEFWKPADPKKAIQVIPDGNTTILRLNISNKSRKLSEPLKITFALQATPVKPRPSGWRGWRIADVTSGIDAKGNSILYAPDLPRNRTKTAGVIWAQDDLWKAYGWVEPVDKANRLKDIISKAHQNGYNVCPYWQVPQVSSYVKEWDYYKYDWSCHTLRDEWCTDVVKFGHILTTCCSRSATWDDFILYHFMESMKKLNVDGWYQDGFQVAGCLNTRHGCGYFDETGRAHETYPIFARRELFKRIYTAIKKENPKSCIIGHMSGTTQIPLQEFADILLESEHVFTCDFVLKLQPTPPFNGYFCDRIPSDTMIAEFNGMPWGTPIAWLALVDKESPAGTGRTERTESLVGWLLLHDMPNVWTSTFWCDMPALNKILKAEDEFGLYEDDVVFHPFWAKSPPVTGSNNKVKISAYSRPGKIMLIVFNTDKSKGKAEIFISADRLGLSKTFVAKDVMTGEKITTTPTSLNIDIPARNFRMLVLE